MKDHFKDFKEKAPCNFSEPRDIKPRELKKILKEYDEENKKIFNTLQSTYGNINKKYVESKYTILQILIPNMNPENANSLEETISIYDRVNECYSNLEEMRNVNKNNLKNIDKQKELFIHQGIEQGLKIYDEVLNITNLSRVKFNNVKKAFIRINIPTSINRNECENRIRLELNNFLSKLKNENGDIKEISKDELKKEIEKNFSNRELFNFVINKMNVTIELYLIDVTGRHSWKKWEKICNSGSGSGAQKLISSIAVICTLIEYDRRKALKFSDINNTSTKVLILDNPFGAASTPIFVDAMHKITNNFNCQLFCFTGLEQSSITDGFKMIYRLKLMESLSDNKAYLYVFDNELDSNVVDKMEHVSLKIEQLSLL